MTFPRSGQDKGSLRFFLGVFSAVVQPAQLDDLLSCMISVRLTPQQFLELSKCSSTHKIQSSSVSGFGPAVSSGREHVRLVNFQDTAAAFYTGITSQVVLMDGTTVCLIWKDIGFVCRLCGPVYHTLHSPGAHIKPMFHASLPITDNPS